MAKKRRTDGYHRRIAEAMERGPRPIDSVRGLAKVIQEYEAADGTRPYKGLRGATYGGIRQYVEGNITNPRHELLNAIATALEVRADWLRFNEGSMTDVQERSREEEDQLAHLEEFVTADFLSGVAQGFGPGSDALLGGARRVVLMHTWDRLRMTPYRSEFLGLSHTDVALGCVVGSALRQPFAALGLDPAHLPHAALTDYVVGVCAGLNQLTAITHVQEEDTNG